MLFFNTAAVCVNQAVLIFWQVLCQADHVDTMLAGEHRAG